MVRTQVQLTEEQHAVLKKIAREEGLSMAEVVRMAVDYLEHLRNRTPSDEAWDRARSIVGKFKSDVTDGSTRHDEYFAESIR